MDHPMQKEVIAFLQSPGGHPGGGPVETIETHGALVFLAGDVALKIKRAVRYDYMDLSTLDRRKMMLRRELELNKPVAPAIYRDLVAVTRSPAGDLALGGTGEPVEWVLRMWRFPAGAELAVIADTRGIDDALAEDLGTAVQAYHTQCPVREMDGPRLIGDILDELDRVFAGIESALGDDRIAQFHTKSRQALKKAAPALKHRADTGHVRRCHGDLHLRNLVLLDGKPVPFDALEFDEILGTCDVLYDLAFLIMDLLHRDLARAANMALNAYLLAARGTEDDGMAVLPLFLGVRAAIRAMVQVQTDQATGRMDDPEGPRLMAEAISYLSPPVASLVLVGGLSSTGKTTVSRALAPLFGPGPGAVHLRSDLERKAMHDVAATAALDEAEYAPDKRGAVYDRVMRRAGRLLAAGHPVLVDATFLNPDHRRAAVRIAHKAGVPVTTLWLDAPLPVLIDRLNTRTRDASDADETVLRRQVASGTAPDDWQVVSAAGSKGETIALARAALAV